MYRDFFKRILDFAVALIGLLALTPVFLILILCLALSNKGQIFFTQLRPGKNGKNFKVIKFKTMNDRRDSDGNLFPDAVRVTKIGKFIRSTSMDEIPQMINVLIGDMSFVGPRPLLVQYLPLYTKEQARRHEVRPGITGWAQVNGRNLCLLSKKFEYDVWYVDNMSFQLDVKIVFKTISNIIERKNIGEGAGVMEQVDDLNFMEKMGL